MADQENVQDQPGSDSMTAALQSDLIVAEAKARAAETLVDLMDNADSESVRLGAARAILGHGKGKKSEEDSWADYIKKNSPQD